MKTAEDIQKDIRAHYKRLVEAKKSDRGSYWNLAALGSTTRWDLALVVCIAYAHGKIIPRNHDRALQYFRLSRALITQLPPNEREIAVYTSYSLIQRMRDKGKLKKSFIQAIRDTLDQENQVATVPQAGLQSSLF